MEKLGAIFILFSLVIALSMGHVISRESNAEKIWFQNICRGKEKLTKLQFYVQDALGGPNATVWQVAEAAITANSRTAFGQVRVLDDLITVGPNRSSEALGRAQGLITSADLTVSGIAMNMNFYFTAGKYNGSTLCILGRNPIDENDRELPVVGGTGDFRMARGYSISNTYSYDPVANYGVLEYTVYVAVVEKSGYTAVSMI
ncbi:Hypothetical predicted protein [Olea europaea subsp. europaea]|uniref:Dirigent protein n=1 Tax=Olea europaea subsp. europaea TaxID=158383 RepID=A0A8S0PCQ9_OLEEU|nr:Hypothetical predicted protein [Olea europaea subsp. europaea]